MKKLLYIILLTPFFPACVTFKQFDDKAKDARDAGREAFIERANGEVVAGKTLTHKNHHGYDASLVRQTNNKNAFKIDGVGYNDSDVVVFQDQHAYHKRWKDIYLIRLVKGKIDLYYFDDMTPGGQGRTTNFFFQKGNEPISGVGVGVLRAAVKDNPQALKKLNGYYPKDRYMNQLNVEKLTDVVKTYDQ